MNDIVEQLRIHSDPTYPDNAPCPLLKKAADEIARLRERVRVLEAVRPSKRTRKAARR